MKNDLAFWSIVTVFDCAMVGVAIANGTIAGAVIFAACTVLAATITWREYKKEKTNE